MGIQMFCLPSIIGCAVLIPLYRTGGALAVHEANNSTVSTEPFMLNTLSNVLNGSNRLWAAWAVMLFVTGWCLWCLWAHCRSYAALQALKTHSLHTHASIIEFIHQKSKRAAAMKTLPKRGDNTCIHRHHDVEEEEMVDFLPIAGLMQLVGTRIAREGKHGAGALGWWKAAGSLLWQSIDPRSMLNSDIKLVEMCVEHLDQRLIELKEEGKKQRKLRRLRSKRTVGDDDINTGTQNPIKSFKSKKGDMFTQFDSWSELQLEDWGPAVRAEVPEIVCPWWLTMENTPAAVNPMLAGGGVLLGKTSPLLRARVQGVRGSLRLWTSAASFVVLYRAGGPAPTDHWVKFLGLNDRLQEMESKIDDETEALMHSMDMATDSTESNHTSTSSGGGGVDRNDSDTHGELHEESSSEVLGGAKNRKIHFCQGIENLKSKVAATSKEKRVAAGKVLEKTLQKLYPGSFQELVPVYNHIPADKAMQKWDHTAGALSRVERQIKLLKKDITLNCDGDGGEEAAPSSNGSELGAAAAVVVVGGGDIELGPISSTTTTTTTTTATTPCSSSKATKAARKAAEKLESLFKVQKELTAELASNESDLAAARAACLASPLGTAYFALFNSQRDARAAAAGHIGSTPEMNMTSEMAPGPDDVNWQGLWAGWRERTYRTIFYCTIPMIVIILFPIGALTGVLTNFNLAVCGSGTKDSTREFWAWYCDGPEILKFLITVVLPISISTFWDTWVMPMVLFIVCQAQRAHASFSKLDKAVISGFYGKVFFFFFTTFEVKLKYSILKADILFDL